MLHILGLMGKGIGIALLCILILAVILLLAVLFVPIRYRIRGNKDAEGGPVGEVKAHWFFHILSGMGAWDGGLHYRVRVLGIPIYDNLRKKQKEKTKKRSAKKEKAKREKSEKKEIRKREPENIEISITDRPVAEDTDRKDKPEAGREVPRERRSFWKRLLDKCRVLWQKIIAFLRMIKKLLLKIAGLPDRIRERAVHIRETVEKWKAFLEREDLKRAFALCKKQLLRIWKNIRPRKVKADVRFGFADPASTGQILAIGGMLYPLLGKTIVLRPEFEEQVLEGHILIKGRITIFILLKALWILYFNKDIKRLIRVWKKEEIADGR